MIDRPAIQAIELCQTYGSQVVLDSVDLTVAEGEAVAIMGANGAGKTTLLRCLAAEIRPRSGEVRWFGRPAAADPASRWLVGVLGHESFLYPDLTAEENLLFAARMCNVPCPARRVAEMLAGAGLRHCGCRLTAQLSRGQRQRVAVLRALVHEPRVLLLDEPFAGLDAEAADWLLQLLADLRDRARAICLAVHDTEKACRLADRVVMLATGRLRPASLVRQDVHATSVGACA